MQAALCPLPAFCPAALLPALLAALPARASTHPPSTSALQESYLGDVYDFYMKHLEDEAPVSDFK